MADSSQQRISYIQETKPGEIPEEAFQALRFTGGSFDHSTETTRSEEVRPDGQRSSMVRTNVSASPSINIELSAKTFDDLIEGVMRATWSDSLDLSADDVSIEESDNGQGKISSVEADLSAITPKQWIHVSGFDTADANGWYKVVDVAEDEITVEPFTASDSNGDSKTIHITGSYIRNGTKAHSYALQRDYGDLDEGVEVIHGCRANQMDVSVDYGEIVTGSVSFEGLKKELRESLAGNGSVDDAPGTEIFNAVDHVRAVLTSAEGSMSAVGADVTSINIALDQNARRQNAVGVLGAAGIAHGSLDATGSLSMYLDAESWSYLERYVDFQKFGLAIVFDDGENGYVFEFPRVALTDEPGNVPGPDDDVMLEFDFAAEPGESYDKTVQICKR